MILFEEDWDRYPTAIVHESTSNRSFVRLAKVYEAMGVKNNLFILALINPELEHINPHDPDLSEATKAAIAMECKINPWYFFREVARAPVKGSRVGTPIRANRGNIALWWSFLNHIYIFLIQPRQTGKSMSTDTLMEWLLLINCVSTTVNLVSKDNKLRVENVERIRDMMSLLPDYLYLKGSKDRENMEEITVAMLDNHYMTHVPRHSEKDAHNLGRGMTTPILQFDESPFQRHIETAMKAAIPAMGAAIDSAKENGTPYGIIHTTTAGKKDDPDGSYIYSLLMRSAVWSERFLDAPNEAELEKLVRAHSKGKNGGVYRINATFSHRQLGYSDEWLAEKLERADQEGEDADRDYFNIWTSGNESLPFSIEIATALRRSQKDVVYQEITKESYILRWYIEEHEIERRMKNSKFLIGSDPSDAGGGDDLTIVIIDVETLEVVAAGTYNQINLISFSRWLAGFMIKYENTIFCPENRSSGQSIIDNLCMILPQHGVDPFKRIFNWVVNDHLEYDDRYREVRGTPMHRRNEHFYAKYKKQFGFATSGSGATSRGELYSTTLKRGLFRAAAKVHDSVLIGQFLGLVTKNGRIDHADGEHDDMVIAWLMCLYVLLHGKNLGYYGIDSSKIFTNAAPKVELTPFEIMHKQEQDFYRDRLDMVRDQLVKESNEHLAMKLEQELRVLVNKIVPEEGQIYSVDQLFNEIKEEKRKAKAPRYHDSSRLNYTQGQYNPYGAAMQNGIARVSASPGMRSFY